MRVMELGPTACKCHRQVVILPQGMANLAVQGPASPQKAPYSPFWSMPSTSHWGLCRASSLGTLSLSKNSSTLRTPTLAQKRVLPSQLCFQGFLRAGSVAPDSVCSFDLNGSSSLKLCMPTLLPRRALPVEAFQDASLLHLSQLIQRLRPPGQRPWLWPHFHRPCPPRE